MCATDNTSSVTVTACVCVCVQMEYTNTYVGNKSAPVL